MKQFITIGVILIWTLAGCIREPFLEGQKTIVEDFEQVSNADELLDSDQWAYFQQTESSSTISLDTAIVHSGQQSIKFTAASGSISKCDIANNDMLFLENEEVYLSAWFYLESGPGANYLFLMDIEEKVAIGAGPGIRLAIDDKGYLLVDRSKYREENFKQNKVVFPKNQWVQIEMELLLHQKDKGSIVVKQDGQTIIQASNISTLPKDLLYLIQGTKGMYQSVQFGITATTANNPTVLYMDDVEVNVLP